MKKILSAIAIVICLCGHAQECAIENTEAFQMKLIREYADPEKSPVKDDMAAFKGLSFYAVDMDFCVEAKLVRTPNEKPFKMPTTGRWKPNYVKYGELHFILKGKTCRLDIFRNVDMAETEAYKNALFLPFTDLTSGNGSYGGGRYIDLEIPAENTVNIDFNKAYNPYCAYNPAYSCPITPKQNDLDIEVNAGVMDYKKQ